MNQGLQVPPVAGPGQQEEFTVHHDWDTFDNIELELAQMGIHALEQPREAVPSITTELLTTMNGEQYADAQNRCRAWHEYIGNVLARVKSLIIQVENEMEIIGVRTKQALIEAAKAADEKKPGNEDIKHHVKCQPRWQELLLEKQKLDQKKAILESRLDGLDRSIKVLSRNLERKRQELESEYGRGGIRRPPMPGMGGGYTG